MKHVPSTPFPLTLAYEKFFPATTLNTAGLRGADVRVLWPVKKSMKK
jgi:hypothetical protein